MVFGRESFANMQKFARFFGLSDVLLVSKQYDLTQIWHEAIKENLRVRIIAAAKPEEATKKLGLGYLFDFT